jgi:hypothetical protein
MPPGKQPDPSLYLRLLAHYRRKNKRALRRREAFPITLPYLIPMMEKAEGDDRPIGWRDSAMFAFGYRVLGRSVEDADLDLQDLTILDDRVLVWLAEDKTHKGEEQTAYTTAKTCASSSACAATSAGSQNRASPPGPCGARSCGAARSHRPRHGNDAAPPSAVSTCGPRPSTSG